MSSAAARSSMKTGSGVAWPIGATPPAGKPVRRSTVAASAIFSERRPAAAARRTRSTRSGPAAIATRWPPSPSAKSKVLRICASGAPIAAAASATVCIGTPGARNSAATPSASINASKPRGGSMATGARVERVAQAVAEEVERHDDAHDGDARHQRVPPVLQSLVGALLDHGAPFGGRRHGAEADETQPRGEDDRRADVDRRLDDQRRVGRGEDVAKQNAAVRRADRFGGGDEFVGANSQN